MRLFQAKMSSTGLRRFLPVFCPSNLGLGLLWASLYCHWFNPIFIYQSTGVGAVAELTYLTFCCASAVSSLLLSRVGNVFFRRGGIGLKMAVAASFIASVFVDYYSGTLLVLFGDPIRILQHVCAACAGFGFAVAWTGWGVWFSKMEIEDLEKIVPFSYVVTPISLFIVQLLTKSIAVPIFVAILSTASVILWAHEDKPLRSQRKSTWKNHRPSIESPRLKASILKTIGCVFVLHTAVAFVWGSVSMDYFSSFELWFGLPMLIGNVLAIGISFWAIGNARTLNIVSIIRWCLAFLVVALVLVMGSDKGMRDIGRVVLIAMQLVFNIFTFIHFAKMGHYRYADPTFIVSFGRGFANLGVTVGTAAGFLLFQGTISDFSVSFFTAIIVLVVICVLVINGLTSGENIFKDEIVGIEDPPSALEPRSLKKNSC